MKFSKLFLSIFIFFIFYSVSYSTQIKIHGIFEKSCMLSSQNTTVHSITSHSDRCVSKFSFKVLADMTSEEDKSCSQNMRTKTLEVHYVVDKETGKYIHIPDILRFKVQYKPVQEIHNLTFIHFVNAETTEIIADKSKQDMFCGYVLPTGRLLPYSKGFACSCNKEMDVLQRDVEFEYTRPRMNWSSLMKWPSTDKRFIPLKSFISQQQYAQNYQERGDRNDEREGYQHRDGSNNISLQYYRDLQTPTVLKNCRQVFNGVGAVYLKFRNDAERIAYCERALRSRAGLKCRRNRPDTVHCLHLSNLWYAVYKLSPAQVKQEITVRVLQQQDHDQWQDFPNVKQRQHTVLTSSINIQNHKRVRLLVPQDSFSTPNIPSQISDNHEEILLLDEDMLNSDGNECYKIGTSFEAFSKQLARCLAPVGSCIGLQPRQLWREDKARKNKGLKGSYMLENFASILNKPLLFDTDSNQLQLRLCTTKTSHVLSAVVEISLPTNYNTLGDMVQIHSVETESIISDKYVEVKVWLRNRLTSHLHTSVRLTGCNATCTLQGQKTIIVNLKPNESKHVILGVICNEIIDRVFICHVEIADNTEATIATRPVRVHMGHTCKCLGSCHCICDDDVVQTSCIDLSPPQLRAAGFVPNSNIRDIKYYSIWHVELFWFLPCALVIGLLTLVLALFCCSPTSYCYCCRRSNRRKNSYGSVANDSYADIEQVPLATFYEHHEYEKRSETLSDMNISIEEEIDNETMFESYKISRISPIEQKSAEVVKDECIITQMCNSAHVYRHLLRPIGEVILPSGTNYCVQGTLSRCTRGDYVFKVPAPMCQYWFKNECGWFKVKQGYPLTTSEFTVYYPSQTKILNEGELKSSTRWRCINVE